MPVISRKIIASVDLLLIVVTTITIYSVVAILKDKSARLPMCPLKKNLLKVETTGTDCQFPCWGFESSFIICKLYKSFRRLS